MKHIETKRFNVAWFKLAEFVSRGEKERAFGMLRLLMHSIDDRALEHQLKGDIYLSFEDSLALESYHYAAQLYAHQDEPKKAIALYEQIITLDTNSLTEHLEPLMELYALLLPLERRTLYVRRLIPLLITIQEFKLAEELLTSTKEHQPTNEYLILTQTFILAACGSQHYTTDQKHSQICALIDQLIFSNSHILTMFLIQLEALHPDLHAYAHTYLIKQGESNDPIERFKP